VIGIVVVVVVEVVVEVVVVVGGFWRFSTSHAIPS
jgi:hypothetical protein